MKVRTAIVGSGRPGIATNCHIPGTLASDNMELVALCDIDPGVYEFARQYHVRAVTDYQQLLGDPEIDMIQIATPDWLHCRQAKEALAAGKNVLLQKPPCLNLQELAQLRTAQVESKAHLKIVLHQRETALCRTIKKLLEDGAIGELREITIRYLGHRFPIQNPKSPYLSAASGGVWVHNGLHWLDEVLFYVGTTPRSCHLMTTRNDEGASEILGEGPNYWSGFFDFGLVTFHFEYNAMLTAPALPSGMYRSLIGTRGELRQEMGNSDLLLFQTGRDQPEKCPLLAATDTSLNDMVYAFHLAIEKYGRELLGGPPEPPYVKHELTLMELLLGAVEKSYLGQKYVAGDLV